MKVEIWSDVMCPFCYIGKRRFEKAMRQFQHKDKVSIIWKSFLLNPEMRTEPGKNISQYLAEVKGWSLDYAKKMNRQVSKMAEGEGLKFDFDKAVVANSFDAHRFIQLAKKRSKGDEAEERLFKAYFTEGENIADHPTLIKLGVDIGLKAGEVKEMLAGKDFAGEVKKDAEEAEEIGIDGVPFFLINEKHTVYGAEDSKVFLKALNEAWEGK